MSDLTQIPLDAEMERTFKPIRKILERENKKLMRQVENAEIEILIRNKLIPPDMPRAQALFETPKYKWHMKFIEPNELVVALGGLKSEGEDE